MAVKINPKSLVADVNKEIGTATPAAYLKTIGKSVVSNKLKAMVAAGIHCGNEITKPKVAKILGTLESFDIRSERMAEYYIKGGFVAIKSQMTEQEIAKIGLSNIMKWSTKLLSDEATGSAKIVQAKIVELQAEAQKRKDAKDAKADADKAMDAAECIGCGACVAACPNASASLFTAAKVSHLSLLPQGQAERRDRAQKMVAQMDAEGFGSCTNHGECEAACPKGVSIRWIARMNRDLVRSLIRTDKPVASRTAP